LNRIEVEIKEEEIGEKKAFVWNRYLQRCKFDHGLISYIDMEFETPTKCLDYEYTGFYDKAEEED
jgi:hypothetical protein